MTVAYEFAVLQHDAGCKAVLREVGRDGFWLIVSYVMSMISPDWVVKAISEIRQARRKDVAKSQDLVTSLEKEAAKLKREIERLVAALALSNDPPQAMLKSISERQERLKEVDREIAAAKAAPRAADQGLDALEAFLTNRIQSFKEAAMKTPEEARGLVQAIFPKLIFRPIQTKDGMRFQIEGEATFCRFFALDGGSLTEASPRGRG